MKKKKEEIMDEGEEDTVEVESVALTGWDTKKVLLRRIIANARLQLERAERLLESDAELADEDETVEGIINVAEARAEFSSDGRVIEGVFDGEHMIGEDGERYNVPPNYASKSKLVEGDLLRLTITDDGRFLYKQRGPIERERVMGALMIDERNNEWKVLANGKKYRVLTASVTFFKGQAGDDVVILIPRGTPSRWAAMENVVRRGIEEAEN